jgi:hypothetical protein
MGRDNLPSGVDACVDTSSTVAFLILISILFVMIANDACSSLADSVSQNDWLSTRNGVRPSREIDLGSALKSK